MTPIERKEIATKLRNNNFKYTEYELGIKVHLNQTQYIDISRGSEGDLYLDLYTDDKIDLTSLEILEDHGRIRFESLIKVLNIVNRNLAQK